MKPGDTITVHIDRLSYDGGRGVGRLDNFVFFIPFTAPGDTVDARVVEIKKNFGVAELVTVKTPSLSRRTPPCPVFGRCGGCVWQHITYEEQLKQKHGLLSHALRAFVAAEKIPPIIASKNEFRYRNRIQVQVQNGRTGFFASGTNSIVPVDDCLIADEKLLPDLALGEWPRAKKLELAIDDTGGRVVRDITNNDGEFTQVNSEINERLKEAVVSYVQRLSNRGPIYDLYCGQGNLSFSLLSAITDSRVTGVELNAAAIDQAKKKSTFGTRVEFIAKDVAAYLRKLTRVASGAIFVLDPPRAGLATVCDEILRLKPALIVYVSCNLGTLARDVQKLSTQYEVKDVVALDMFPQTEYLETVVVLGANN